MNVLMVNELSMPNKAPIILPIISYLTLKYPHIIVWRHDPMKGLPPSAPRCKLHVKRYPLTDPWGPQTQGPKCRWRDVILKLGWPRIYIENSLERQTRYVESTEHSTANQNLL